MTISIYNQYKYEVPYGFLMGLLKSAVYCTCTIHITQYFKCSTVHVASGYHIGKCSALENAKAGLWPRPLSMCTCRVCAQAVYIEVFIILAPGGPWNSAHLTLSLQMWGWLEPQEDCCLVLGYTLACSTEAISQFLNCIALRELMHESDSNCHILMAPSSTSRVTLGQSINSSEPQLLHK
jgi:hypothetical protein